MRSKNGRAAALALCFVILAAHGYGAVDSVTCMTALGVPAQDCDALVDLYDSTNGESWTSDTNWGETTAPWYGVTVSGGRVMEIALQANALEGPIPGGLDGLSNLAILDLSGNQLTGPIPGDLGNLGNLDTLLLSRNRMTGPIPAQLGNLGDLRVLWLELNQLTGPVPAELGSLGNLTSLDLSDNHLTGPIPTELGDIDPRQIILLFLDNNHLDADADGNALIPAQIQDWYDDILGFKDVSNQTIAPETLPRNSWRYKLFRDAAN